jgi:hypothetical protein
MPVDICTYEPYKYCTYWSTVERAATDVWTKVSVSNTMQVRFGNKGT